MDSGIIIGIIILVLWIIGVIINAGHQSNKRANLLKQINEFDVKLKSLEDNIKSKITELSKWVYACKKCQNDGFMVSSINQNKASILCLECHKTYELKVNNAFYSIDCIRELSNYCSRLELMLNKDKLIEELMEYLRFDYQFKGNYAPKNDARYVVYNYFFNKLETNYLSLKYWSSKKEFALLKSPLKATMFKSDGSLMDEIENRKSRVKMGKLNPNRPALAKTLEKEWNYKSITRGKKSNIIKTWAKNTNQRCPDGRKCGGVYFKELLNSDIAYGHILSQDFAKTFPHHHEQVHHPDNLYLTCKSCNSSLGGNNANKELINRIKNESGTIGDWLRNYINEIKSIS